MNCTEVLSATEALTKCVQPCTTTATTDNGSGVHFCLGGCYLLYMIKASPVIKGSSLSWKEMCP